MKVSIFSGVSIPQETSSSILSQLDAAQKRTSYTAYKTYFELYVTVSSALGTKIPISGLRISFKFHYGTLQTTSTQESPSGISAFEAVVVY